jgi:hypothetical protein
MEIDLYNTCVLRHKWYNWISWTVIPYITTGQTITIEQQSIYSLITNLRRAYGSKKHPRYRGWSFANLFTGLATYGYGWSSYLLLLKNWAKSWAYLPPRSARTCHNLGSLGKQGTGYNISFLSDQLRRILNIDRMWDIAVVGAGDIGHAIAGYQGFARPGFSGGDDL